MSHANRNFVIAYIFLVGLPLLCLAAVLKNGRGLTAPYSIDGTWKIETRDRVSPDHPSLSPCAFFFSSLSSGHFSISQSGKTLVIGLSGGSRTTIGTLEGKVIKAQFAGADSSNFAGCGGALTLNALLDPQSDPRTLHGTLSVNNCSYCSIEFRAVRQPRTAGGAAQ
jgi:hypothetical protein